MFALPQKSAEPEAVWARLVAALQRTAATAADVIRHILLLTNVHRAMASFPPERGRFKRRAAAAPTPRRAVTRPRARLWGRMRATDARTDATAQVVPAPRRTTDSCWHESWSDATQ